MRCWWREGKWVQIYCKTGVEREGMEERWGQRGERETERESGREAREREAERDTQRLRGAEKGRERETRGGRG